MVVVETAIAAGQTSPPHQHDYHVSIVYLVRRKLKGTIDADVFIAGTEDIWCNQTDVAHHLEALVDCVSTKSKADRSMLGSRQGPPRRFETGADISATTSKGPLIANSRRQLGVH
jgi:hypothetical protein